ncbi:MAG: bifunctional adenosylcobinamide kinase/adenosylcobinamide-phosphate guanylyltransferase [Eubacteriales bacterium]|jgi:adenosylcobinamide kinase/adenosylcobinamide-phosphate guanylyltransferase
MIHLVTGGAGSGKSEYAEQQILKLGENKNRLYVATMIPGADPENNERIRRHRERRENMNFRTVECPFDLNEVEIPEHCAVLIEDIPNLLANEMFKPEGIGIHAGNRIISGFLHIAHEAEDVVVVTDDVFCDGCVYEGGTRLYMQLLGLIAQDIVCEADRVTEIVYGIPIRLK